ncbi:hypothetical protein HWV62_1643 [Athelia sp. TMB]|nr:hypothetical protein HWV62_1643 [Athelia sp. TMB]
MNEGDIGRVEDMFMPWVFIFKGCGKHKYAAQMMKHLHNVHFVYPDGLKHEGPFSRGGLRIYGGQFSNHTKSRILEESPLIELYKNTRTQVENIFHLDHRTTRHSAPDMTVTFKMLVTYMEKHRTNEYVPGRKSPYSIPDAAAQGMHTMLTTGGMAAASAIDGDEGDLEQEDEQGVEQEVDDDGGLDV